MEEINEEQKKAESTTDNDLQEAVKSQLEKIRMAALLSGSKAICSVILNYIAEFKTTPGKQTFRQQERLIKKIQDFCETGVSRTIDENGNIIPAEKKEE